MSGLDKFMKGPSKSPKKTLTKDKEKTVKPKSPPKRAVKQESQVSDEEIPADDSSTSPLKMDDSEKMMESQDLIPDASIEEENLGAHSGSPHSLKFTKFQLKCTNKKCNYQRILMKSSLSSSDLTCPKCESQMRQKQKGQ